MRQIIIILFSIFSLATFAQQGLVMDFGEIDSTEIESNRQIEYHKFVNGTFGSDLMLDEIQLPKFNAQQEYRSRYTVSIDALPINNYIGGSIRPGSFGGLSPYFFNSQILSEAAYKVGDKFVVGGFSYGANSPLSAPVPPQQSSYFNTHGSTMFMQYKVSKSVSIETSISVGQNRGPGY